MPARESAGTDAKAQAVTYLLEILRTPVARTDKRAPLQMSLRFLVCTWATKQDRANEILLQLAFAAMEQEGWDLEFEALPVHAWSAFGISPRPSFVLRIPGQTCPDNQVEWVPGRVSARSRAGAGRYPNRWSHGGSSIPTPLGDNGHPWPVRFDRLAASGTKPPGSKR